VIKLEGGSDFDLRVLDLPDPEEDKKEEADTGPADRRDAKRKKDNKKENKEVSVLNLEQEKKLQKKIPRVIGCAGS
jgi:hypothetical protein